jgi:hypothetical protein
MTAWNDHIDARANDLIDEYNDLLTTKHNELVDDVDAAFEWRDKQDDALRAKVAALEAQIEQLKAEVHKGRNDRKGRVDGSAAIHQEQG